MDREGYILWLEEETIQGLAIEIRSIIEDIKRIIQSLDKDLNNEIKKRLRYIETKYGILILLSVIKELLEYLKIQLNWDNKAEIIELLCNWEAYAFSYTFSFERQLRPDDFFDILYSSIIGFKRWDNSSTDLAFLNNLNLEQKFYFVWHKCLYFKCDDDAFALFPARVVILENEMVELVFDGGDIIKVNRKRLVYIRIWLRAQEFLQWWDIFLKESQDINKFIDLFDDDLFKSLKWDFYMMWKVREIYFRCISGDCWDFWSDIEVEKLETQVNLVPFLALDIIRCQKSPGCKEEKIHELYKKIAIIMVSYFGINGLKPENWYVKILSRILDQSPQYIVSTLKRYYDNFISTSISERETLIYSRPRWFFAYDIVYSKGSRLTPPVVVSKLEEFLGPLGIVIYYPDRKNMVTYGKVNIAEDLKKSDLDGLLKRLKPWEREEITRCGNLILPFWSFALLTNFGPTDKDNALILVIRGGKWYPPLNKDILEIILKAVNKDSFNVEALLDFFVLNEAGETRAHLKSVAGVYEWVLRKIGVKSSPNIFGKFRDIISQVTNSLAEILIGGKHWEERLGLESKYHDIGKIGPPKAFIQKEGSLEEREKEIVEMHTILGAAFLQYMRSKMDKTTAKKMEVAVVLALMHHTLSKKYPFDLNMTPKEFEEAKQRRINKIESLKEKDELIYFEYAIEFLKELTYKRFHDRFRTYAKQILAMHIADIYDALREDRSYRASIEPKKAIEILKEELAALDNPTHPLHELWQKIKPKLTVEFLEGLRKGENYL